MRIFDLKRFSVWLAFVIVLAALLFIGTSANAQVVYGQQTFNGPVTIGGTSAAHASASLDIQSTTKGLAIPRMNTAQQNAISSPVNGLQVYNTDSNGICFYSSANGWRILHFGSMGGGGSTTWQQTLSATGGNVLTQANTINGGGKKQQFQSGQYYFRTGSDGQLGVIELDTNAINLKIDSQMFGLVLSKASEVAYLGNLDQSFGLGFWRTPKLFKFDGGKLHYPAAPTATDSTGIGYVYVAKADTIYKMALGTLLGYAGGGGGGTNLGNSDLTQSDATRTFESAGGVLIFNDNIGDGSFGIVGYKEVSLLSNDVTVGDGSRVTIDGGSSINLKSAAIVDNTAVNGQVLTLIDNTTGEAEWADAGGGSTTLQQAIDNGNTVNDGSTFNLKGYYAWTDSIGNTKMYVNANTNEFMFGDGDGAGHGRYITIAADGNILLDASSIINLNAPQTRMDSYVVESSFSDSLICKYNPDSLRFDINSNLPITINNGLTVYPNGTYIGNNCATGWASYVDGLYTSASPLVFTATNWTTLVNHCNTIIQTQMPCDLDSMYSRADTGIIGLVGDGYSVNIEFKARPNTANTTYIDVGINIGGAVGLVYPRTYTLAKGNNVEQFVSISTSVYSLDTWAANSGKIQLKTSDSVDIYDYRLVIHRLHKARP